MSSISRSTINRSTINRSTITLIRETDIDMPAAAVWQVVADYARDVEWRGGVLSMVPTPAGVVQVGTTTAEDLKVAGRTYHNDGEVVVVEPGSRFEWRTTAGAVAHGVRQVTPIDAGRCRVRLELHVTPTGLNRFLAPMLKKVLATGLGDDLQRLRTLAEAEMTIDHHR